LWLRRFLIKKMLFSNREILKDINFQSKFFFYDNLIAVKLEKTIGKVNFLGSQFGPFSKGEKTKTKFWIALLLNEIGFCKILKPKWMRVKWLGKKIFLEKKTNNLHKIHYNYIEICNAFIKYNLNFFSFKEISLVEELFSIRCMKLWNGIKIITSQVNALKFDKICSIEFLNFKKIIQFLLYFLTFL
jgi:hypothetical protein